MWKPFPPICNPWWPGGEMFCHYITVLWTFFVFVTMELQFILSALNIFLGIWDCLSFTSKWTVHFWRVILFTNILMDFAIIVNIWSASTSSHSCLLFLKEHQNETAHKKALQNVFAYFMSPFLKSTNPWLVTEHITVRIVQPVDVSWTLFLKSTNPWHVTEHITVRIMQPVDVFITNHLLLFGTYCFP